jgi:hypothetical protein
VSFRGTEPEDIRRSWEQQPRAALQVPLYQTFLPPLEEAQEEETSEKIIILEM